MNSTRDVQDACTTAAAKALWMSSHHFVPPTEPVVLTDKAMFTREQVADGLKDFRSAFRFMLRLGYRLQIFETDGVITLRKMGTSGFSRFESFAEAKEACADIAMSLNEDGSTSTYQAIEELPGSY